MQPVFINGHRLPQQLTEAIADGRWQQAHDLAALEAVFGEAPIHPSFYGLEALKLENSAWVNERDPNYLGIPDSIIKPGDVDPANSVLIGDLGPDRPFALDYRTKGPQVVYLREGGQWVFVSSDIDELFAVLGMDG